jgi:hypothetical protein
MAIVGGVYPIRAKGLERIIVHGSFAPQGAAVDPVITAGVGWTVAYTNVGLYTVTMTDACAEITTVVGMVTLTTALTSAFVVGGVPTTQVMTFQIINDAGAAVELDASALGGNDGSEVNFIAICRNTGLDY